MYIRVPGREAWMMILTFGRLCLALGLCVAVAWHQPPALAIGWLVAIVVADGGDGVIARYLGVDTTNRRIADAVVDRITIHGAMAVEAVFVPGAFWLMLPVFIRDVVLIAYNLWLFKHKRSIVTAGNIHRFGTTLYAVLYGIALYPLGLTAQWLAAAISIVVWFLLLDYLRAGWLIPRQPKGQPLARYQACGLEALRGIQPVPKSESTTFDSAPAVLELL